MTCTGCERRRALLREKARKAIISGVELRRRLRAKARQRAEQRRL